MTHKTTFLSIHAQRSGECQNKNFLAIREAAGSELTNEVIVAIPKKQQSFGLLQDRHV
jgi:hypothetical protein